MHSAVASAGDERRRQFRRLLVVSASAHLVLGVLVTLAPHPSARSVDLPAVVRVDLVSMPARPAPSRPAPPKPAPPKPVPKAPEPPPPPKPPTPEKVVLPQNPTPPKPQPPKPKPAPEKPKPPQEVDYEDVLAKLREEAGESEPAEAPAEETAPARTGGVGVLVSPEEAAWRRRAKQHVTQAWVLAQGFRTQDLSATVEVDLGPGGDVRSTHLVRSSGNPWFDDSVERALRKASPLPAPPESGVWTFSFHPGDVY